MKIRIKAERNLREGLTGEYVGKHIVPNINKLNDMIEKLIKDELYCTGDVYDITFIDFEFKCDVYVNRKEYTRDQKLKELLKDE